MATKETQRLYFRPKLIVGDSQFQDHFSAIRTDGCGNIVVW